MTRSSRTLNQAQPSPAGARDVWGRPTLTALGWGDQVIHTFQSQSIVKKEACGHGIRVSTGGEERSCLPQQWSFLPLLFLP